MTFSLPYSINIPLGVTFRRDSWLRGFRRLHPLLLLPFRRASFVLFWFFVFLIIVNVIHLFRSSFIRQSPSSFSCQPLFRSFSDSRSFLFFICLLLLSPTTQLLTTRCFPLWPSLLFLSPITSMSVRHPCCAFILYASIAFIAFRSSIISSLLFIPSHQFFYFCRNVLLFPLFKFVTHTITSMSLLRNFYPLCACCL